MRATILTDQTWTIEFPEGSRRVIISVKDKDAMPLFLSYAKEFSGPEIGPAPDPSLGQLNTFVFYLKEEGIEETIHYHFPQSVPGSVNVIVCNAEGQPVAQTSKSYPIAPAPTKH